MDAGNQVLAHADIDAMLSAQAVTQDLPKAVPISFASAPREPGPSAPAPDVLLSTVARLTERLDAVEAAVKKMGQMEQGIVETGLAIQQLRQSLQVLAQHTQAVIASIQGHLSKPRSNAGLRPQEDLHLQVLWQQRLRCRPHPVHPLRPGELGGMVAPEEVGD